MYSKKTGFKNWLNTVSIFSSRLCLGLYAFKRKAYFASVIMDLMQCLTKVKDVLTRNGTVHGSRIHMA